MDEEFVLARAATDYRPIHEPCHYLFNSYYNTAGPMRRAAVNMNLLMRLNRELAADFDPACFRHEAVSVPE